MEANSFDEQSYDIDEDYNYQGEYDDTDLNRMQSYVVLEETDFEAVQKSLINNIIEHTYLSEDESVIVLIYFGWNTNHINDHWYDDVEQNRQKCGLDISPAIKKTLLKAGVEENNQECLVCYEERTEENSDDFVALGCKHFFCLDCWREHLKAGAADLYTACGLSCPQKGCPLVIPKSIWKQLADAETYKSYSKSMIKNYTSNSSDLKWCPDPKCGRAIQCELHGNKDIECSCGTRFCFSCGKNAHRPCSCEMVYFWDMKNNSESENILWLKANTKPCPNCNKNIEKNQGCNHMQCLKTSGGCGFHFCWICLQKWESHNDYYNCNQYDEKKDATKDIRQNAQDELNKYMFYFDRYNNHLNALKLLIPLTSKINDDVINLQDKVCIKYDQLEFLGKALSCIKKARNTLLNTYIFGYYMKEKSKEKMLFEHNQRILEMEADKLHEYMEKDAIDKILNKKEISHALKEFESLKSSVINLTAASLKYQENLVNDIENKMMHTVD